MVSYASDAGQLLEYNGSWCAHHQAKSIIPNQGWYYQFSLIFDCILMSNMLSNVSCTGRRVNMDYTYKDRKRQRTTTSKKKKKASKQQKNHHCTFGPWELEGDKCGQFYNRLQGRSEYYKLVNEKSVPNKLLANVIKSYCLSSCGMPGTVLSPAFVPGRPALQTYHWALQDLVSRWKGKIQLYQPVSKEL